MSKREDIHSFFSMQLLFRNKTSNINFLKAISEIDSLDSHFSDKVIESEAEYIDLIDDICDDLSSASIFGKYKN
jgi:hypothetical protein